MDFKTINLNGTDYNIKNGVIDEADFNQDFIAEFIEYESDEQLQKAIDALCMLIGFGFLRGVETVIGKPTEKWTEKTLLIDSIKKIDWKIFKVKELENILDVIFTQKSYTKDMAKKINLAISNL